MEVKKAKAGEKSAASLKPTDSEDRVEKEKQLLKSQISELETLISQVEANLHVTRFGDIDKTFLNFPLPAVDPRAAKKVPDVNVLFQKELLEFIGFRCVKCTKTEYIVHYKPYDKIGRSETYLIQILSNDGKGSLGKWVMPLGLNMKKILAETPIDNLSMVVPLMKNWKLYIDCYTQRKAQFYELKEAVSDASNCTVDASLDYTWITLQLFGLHDKEKDRYFDLTIYLSYKRNETRPWKVQTEWSLKKCSTKQENELNAYTKCFKNASIAEGFRLFTETPHPVFSWTTGKDEDSPLELNNTSDSDEESYLEIVKSIREKSMKKRRKRRESKERQKRLKGKKKAVKSQPKDSTNEENQNLSNKPRLSPQKTQKIPKLPLRLQQSNSQSESDDTVDELAGKAGHSKSEISTIVEVHKKPAATVKKSSKVDKRKSADKTDGKSTPERKQAKPVGILSAKKKVEKKMTRAITSTPLRKKIASKVTFVPMSEELSPIVSDWT